MIRTILGTFAAAAMLTGGTAGAQDGMPQFAISYFAGECPSGWVPTDGTDGRFLLPTMLGGGSGSFIGEALAPQGEPKHSHAKATGSVSITSRNFVLIGGCCNDNLAPSGSHSMTGSASESTGALPYIQYKACTKTTAPSGDAPPSGLMTFGLLPTCPVGWSPVNSAAGRFIVGLPENGAPAATFGGKALDPGEIRTHTHNMSGNINLASHGIAGGSGCCAGGYASSGSTGYSAATAVDASDNKYDSAAQAPYYTATLCRKN